MKEKELLISKQKAIIDKIVSHLATLGTSFYYESTIDVCSEVYNTIHDKDFLNREDKEIVEKLSARDIQILLSYNSSCC